MRKKVRIFTVHSEKAEEIREELMMNFPAFLADCMAHKETFQLKYSELGNAIFYLKYDYDIKEFVAMAFFDRPEKPKYSPRKLTIPKTNDS